MNSKRFLAPLLLLAAVVLLAGCKASGGGYIPGIYDAKANFGFTYDSSSGKLKGSYQDGYVKLKFEGGPVGNPPITGECTDTLNVSYTSTNRSWPGSGYLWAKFCDYGEPGFQSGDSLSIDIYSGPYAQYQNAGTVQGNIQVDQNKK